MLDLCRDGFTRSALCPVFDQVKVNWTSMHLRLDVVARMPDVTAALKKLFTGRPACLAHYQAAVRDFPRT